MAGDAIEVEYQLTVDDYAKFSAIIAETFHRDQGFIKRFTYLFKYMLIGMFLPLGIIFLINIIYDGDSVLSLIHSMFFGFGPFLLVTLFFMTFIYSVFPKLTNRKRITYEVAKKMYGSTQNQTFLDAGKIHIDRNGFTCLSRFSEHRCGWQAVESVGILENNFCIFLTAVSGVFIPSRFFKSEDEKQRIYTQCMKWWEAARENPVPAEGVA